MDVAPAQEGPAPGGPPPELSEQLTALSARIDALTDASEQVTLAEVVADLESAHEELRVADEEVRVQHEEIARLLEDRGRLEWQHQRLLELLPLPVLVTDRRGMVRSVNAAAAHQAAMRVSHMVRRPVAALVALEDRSRLRDALTRLDPLTRPGDAVTMTIVARDGTEHPVRAHLSLRAGADEGDGDVVWALLEPPARSGPARTPDEASQGTSQDEAAAGGLLPQALVGLAALGLRETSVQDLLQQAAEICQVAVGEGAELSLEVGAPLEPVAVASTGNRAQAIDGAQVRAGEGPCTDAYASREMVVSHDLGAEPRWPRLAREECVRGVAVVAVPLRIGDEVVGAFNLYGRPGAVGDRARAAELLGGAVAALVHERHVRDELRLLAEDMERALSSRATIDQAKGIVMGELGCSPQAAFDHLVRLSSTQGVKLRVLAEQLVRSRGAGGGGSPDRP